jgi:hypothetical protein
MKKLQSASITLALALLAGCHSTTDIRGTGDAEVDTPADTSPDPLNDTLPDPEPPPAGYLLHEWGVLVHEAGSTSVHGPTPVLIADVAYKPVIYLYAEEELVLDVTIGFSSGESWEVWPPRPLGPTVDWRGLEVRPGPCETTPFPTAIDSPGIDDMCEACMLGTCVVEDAACITHGDVTSTLLFYNGEVPGFAPPLAGRAELDPDARTVAFDVTNVSESPVEGVWLLYRRTESACSFPTPDCPIVWADLALAYLDVVEPGAGHALDLPVVHLESELDGDGIPLPGTLGTWDEWEELASELHAALRARGLFEQEASAFVSSWDLTLFGVLGDSAIFLEPLYREGASMLYFTGRERYDAVFPLEASPAPAGSVRLGMVYHHL